MRSSAERVTVTSRDHFAPAIRLQSGVAPFQSPPQLSAKPAGRCVPRAVSFFSARRLPQADASARDRCKPEAPGEPATWTYLQLSLSRNVAVRHRCLPPPAMRSPDALLDVELVSAEGKRPDSGAAAAKTERGSDGVVADAPAKGGSSRFLAPPPADRHAVVERARSVFVSAGGELETFTDAMLARF